MAQQLPWFGAETRMFVQKIARQHAVAALIALARGTTARIENRD